MATKKSSKKSDDTDPATDFTSQLVDHMAQGNPYVPPQDTAEDEPDES